MDSEARRQQAAQQLAENQEKGASYEAVVELQLDKAGVNYSQQELHGANVGDQLGEARVDFMVRTDDGDPVLPVEVKAKGADGNTSHEVTQARVLQGLAQQMPANTVLYVTLDGTAATLGPQVREVFKDSVKLEHGGVNEKMTALDKMRCDGDHRPVLMTCRPSEVGTATSSSVNLHNKLAPNQGALARSVAAAERVGQPPPAGGTAAVAEKAAPPSAAPTGGQVGGAISGPAGGLLGGRGRH